ncbi:MAG: helix-turn-helix domain-containing protein [Clostridia bacterium]|nr:helix-turn-helix domain-containing protein [Clostridia bacterium]
MKEEVLSFIKSIEDGTGLKLKIYLEDGNPIDNIGQPLSHFPLGAVETDAQNNCTIFPLQYGSQNYYGVLEGAKKEQTVYASLVKKLAERTEKKEIGLSKADFLRAVLFGEVNHTQIDRYVKKFRIKDGPVCVMILSGQKSDIALIKSILINYCSSSNDFVQEVDAFNLAFVKFSDGESGEYQSPTEYAEFLRQSLYEETGVFVRVSIGSRVNELAQVGVSFSQALSTARMSESFSSHGEVHAFKEYVLIKIIEDLPRHKINEYLEILKDSGAKEIFADKEMLETAEEFMENGLNVSETARKMYLHRNTLMYRLDKIENATGLDIRKFADAVTFRLIIILSKLSR